MDWETACSISTLGDLHSITAKRDAVDEQHDVRPGRFRAAGTLHAVFGGHVEDIPLPVAPVDVVQVEALGIALDGLFQGRSQGDQVVDRLIGLEQAVVFDVLELLDGRLDVLLAEEKLPPLVVDAVEPLELLAQNPFQQDVAGLSLPRGKRL